MQRRRVHALELGLIPLNTTSTLIGTIDETNGVNLHGLRIEANLLPVTASSAQSQGTWVCWCMPDESSPIPDPDIAPLEAEASNAFMWGMGTWACSNITPAVICFNPSTSRNCQNGARIAMIIRNNVSTGVAPSVIQTMTYFTKSL